MYRISLPAVKASLYDKDYIQQTDNIILPESQSKNILNRTINKKNNKPLYFFISPPSQKKENKKQICCRIADFSNSDYSTIILPDWMFDNLGIGNKGLITINEVLIDNGREVTFQPHCREMIENITKLNLDISNVLSSVVSNYGCLTNNTTIEVTILGEKWKIDIKELKDIVGKNKIAISTINVDLELNLLPALNQMDEMTVKDEIITKKEMDVKDEIIDSLPDLSITPPPLPSSKTKEEVDLEEVRKKRLKALGMM